MIKKAKMAARFHLPSVASSPHPLITQRERRPQTHLNWKNHRVVYDFMRYAASAIGNAGSFTHALLSVLEGIGVNFIDLVSYGNGKGSVGATHPDQAAFDAPCETAGKVFTEMIEEGLSIRTR